MPDVSQESALRRGDLRSDHQQQSIAITRTGKATDLPEQPVEDRVLRAKYLDWCSAQVADHFLALTPDEIFELAERASRADVATVPDGSASPLVLDTGDLSSYRAVVERVTEVLTQQLELPTFDEWLELYRKDRAGVEARLLGFWRDVR